MSKHKENWLEKKDDNEHITNAQSELAKAEDSNSAISAPCPACAQSALLELEIDYDCDGEDWYPVGPFVERLRCPFCDLSLNDFEEIDHFALNDHLSKSVASFS